MPEQVIIVDEKGRRPKLDRLDKEQLDVLSKVLDKLPDLIPYLAAFGYGFIVGRQVEGKTESGIRVGCEAMLFMHLASGLPGNITPSPTQLFGVAGLTAIGLTLPIAGIEKQLAERAKVLQEASKLAQAPMEDKPYYSEWVMATVTGSTWKNYCDWMLEFYPAVRAKVCG